MSYLNSLFKRLPDWMIPLVNLYALPSLAVLFALLVIFGGLTPIRTVILVVGLGALFVFWLVAHARQSDNVPETPVGVLEKLSAEGKFAVIAFESEFCLASTLVGQRLADLEKAHPGKIQVYSLSVLQDPGKTLFRDFKGRVTPTFVLLSPSGKVLDDWPLVLPIERVSYALSEQG
ncbi:MAG TPA: hypothetical protein VMT34_03305 [Aggregatilineales bacterium]|nr:hypothetical protein [Aggregatilineales bacterium]